MSHHWREMDPEGAAAQDRYYKRLNSLRDKFKDVSLSEFTVGELGPVMRLMGLCHTSTGQSGVSNSDFKILEEKILIQK